jgi:hypothetical protein
MMVRSGAVPAVMALLFAATPTHAGEIEPRSYVNTPVGINFLLAGYAYSDGGLSTAASSPIKDAIQVNEELSFRIESPFRGILWALWIKRSRMASGRVGSPIWARHLSTGSCAATRVERRP